MAHTKNYKIILLAICFLSLILSYSADAVEWDNYTSFEEVRNLKVIDDSLYITTSGGLIVLSSFDALPKSFHKLDGLGTNNIIDIMKDANGDKWITGFGRLIKWSNGTFEQFLFFENLDNNLFQLHTLLDDDSYIWIGSSLGLVLFSKISDGGQIEDSYTMFGDLNPNPTVNDLLLRNDTIWLATSDGVAFADYRNPALLKSPSNWTTISSRNFAVLDNNEFMSIKKVGTSLYALNKVGLYKIDIDAFGDVSLTETELSLTTSFLSMTQHADTLLLLTEQYNIGTLHYVLDDSLLFSTSVGGISPSSEIIFDNIQWVGSSENGVVTIDNAIISDFEFGGLPDNVVADIAVDSKGTMYAGFDNRTYAQSSGSQWEDFSFSIGQDATVTMIDSLDRVWMGTWGKGVWVLDNDTLINYDENNSTLRGNSDNPPTGLGWVYTTGMDTDGRYVYLTSYRAVNDFPIAIGDMENLNSLNGWDSIGTTHGLTNHFLTSLDYDNGKVSVGTESDGVYECTVGENKECRHLTRENSLLISNSVRDVAYAPNGELWVGTNFGLSRYDIGIDFFRDIKLPESISSDINALEFDSRGNLWIGTQNGLALRNPDDGSYDVFTTFNSGLISDFIQNITFDKFSGKIYVATDKGFSVISSLQGTPVFEVVEVIAFPNPFVINSLSDKLTFNFGRKADVTIFNSAGEHIISMPVNSSWDGKNDRGNNVASGVYFFLVKDENGNIGKGKILLVRN